MFECDEILIKCVQCYPALYSIDSNSEFDNNNKNNEVYWDDIQKEIGIQKSWLKIRWQRIFTDYKKTIIYNHIHSKKVPTFKWAKNLNFIPIDLNGKGNIIFDDFSANNKKAFQITQQMLEDCDINETVTLETVSKCKSLEIERISEPKASRERCEDLIFGELVVAMLKKFDTEEKKRAKKEIMNILL